MKTAHAHSRDANAQRRNAGKCSRKIIIKIVRPKLNWHTSTSCRKLHNTKLHKDPFCGDPLPTRGAISSAEMRTHMK
jgi:hypothetical protein